MKFGQFMPSKNPKFQNTMLKLHHETNINRKNNEKNVLPNLSIGQLSSGEKPKSNETYIKFLSIIIDKMHLKHQYDQILTFNHSC